MQQNTPCAACGKTLHVGARFCTGCGAPVAMRTQAPAPPQPPAPAASEAASGLPTNRSFGWFRELVLRVGRDVQRLRDLAVRMESDEAANLTEVLALIDSSSFTVAVVGEFKRGKSTFINALLGAEALPSDIEPCSATLNRVTYGPEPRASVIFRAETPGGAERSEDVPIERLADYVTKLTPESTTMSSKVKEAVIFYPVQLCRNNVDIIDTPGLEDDEVMTQVTLDALSSVHSAIMVIMANAPFGQTEGNFLRQVLLKGHTSVMFVVTAIDRIARERDRERVLATIRARIVDAIREHAAEQYGEGTEAFERYLQRHGTPTLFGLSGYEALEGQRTHDAARYAASAFEPFKMALEQFLTRERGARSLIDRLTRAAVAGDKVRQRIAERRQALAQRTAAVAADTQAAMQRHQSLRSRADDIVNAIRVAPVASAEGRMAARFQAIETRLKTAAAGVIEQAQLSPDDLGLARKAVVGGAISNTGDALANRLPQGQIKDTSKKAVDTISRWVKGRTANAQSDDEEETQATTMLAAGVNGALAKEWNQVSGFVHLEIQRLLQEEYGRVAQLVGEVERELVQTTARAGAHAPSITMPPRPLDDLLRELPVVSGLWAALDGTRLRVGPTLTHIRPEIERTAALIDANISFKLLRRADVDHFKSDFIRTMSERISRPMAAEAISLQQAVNSDIGLAFGALADTASTTLRTRLDLHLTTLAAIERAQDREAAVAAHEGDELAKLEAEAERICATLRRIADDLGES